MKKGVLEVNWKLESTEVLAIIWCASMTSEQIAEIWQMCCYFRTAYNEF